MKRIKILLKDETLSGLVAEQIAFLPGVTIDSDPADLVITDEITTLEAPHLVLGSKASGDHETLSLPLRLGELRDRVRYLLSGRGRFAGSDIITFGDFQLNTEDGTMEQVSSGLQTRLTDKEKLILQNLYEAGDYQLDRKSLLQSVWGYAESAETHTLETHLYRLRQKLEETFDAADLITTKDGIYTLRV